MAESCPDLRSLPLALLAWVTGILAAVGIVWQIDKKRLSDPEYKSKVEKNRRLDRLAAEVRLQSRLDSMADPHNPEWVQRFTMERFEMAKYCMDLDERRIAAECMADALFMMSHCSADRILRELGKTLQPEVHRMVCAQYTALRETCVHPR